MDELWRLLARLEELGLSYRDRLEPPLTAEQQQLMAALHEHEQDLKELHRSVAPLFGKSFKLPIPSGLPPSRARELASRRCFACGSHSFWVSRTGVRICRICHPPVEEPQP